MYKEYLLSVNQLADFSKGTEATKKRIIRQQKTPNTFRVAYYQLAKARMKKCIEKHGDLAPIFKGIDELTSRKLDKPRQIIDRTVSLEAMRRFINLKLPDLLYNVNHTIVKHAKSKSIVINGVEIIISPDIIVKIEIDGKKYVGAVKVHISKNNIFDNDQSKYISSLLFKYLKEVVASHDEEVLEELCLSIDVFGEKITHAPLNLSKSLSEIEVICEEIKSMWYAA